MSVSLYVRSECSKPEQLVVTFAAGYIGKYIGIRSEIFLEIVSLE